MNILRKIFGQKKQENLRDTLEELIEDTPEADSSLAPSEKTLLTNVLNLDERTAYDIMVPRADIAAVPVKSSLKELVDIFTSKGFSRVPVYRKTLDDVIGYVHIKDVLASTQSPESFRLTDLIRPILFISPSIHVMDLMIEMRRTTQLLALVVDEYGGIDGLVAMGDIISEIVGDLETMQPVNAIQKTETGWIADARTPLYDLEDQIGFFLDKEERQEDIDTLGGFLTTALDCVPEKGASYTHSSGYMFEILDSDPRRIKSVKIEKGV